MIAVTGVAVGIKVFAPGSSAFSAVQAIEMVPGSHTMAALEAERSQLIAMTTAARTLTVVAKPKLASPAEVAAANPGTTGGTGSGGIVYVTSTPPDPGSAQSIAYNMLASFGFSPTTFFGCLKDIWNRESGWRYDAENASGAYGIPQALPGSKMACAGADWQTNPATQIKWGLGYIKAIYGDPCKAWAFEASQRLLLTPRIAVSHSVTRASDNGDRFTACAMRVVTGLPRRCCPFSTIIRSFLAGVSFLIALFAER